MVEIFFLKNLDLFHRLKINLTLHQNHCNVSQLYNYRQLRHREHRGKIALYFQKLKMELSNLKRELIKKLCE